MTPFDDSMAAKGALTREARDRQLAVVCRLGVDCTPDYVTNDPDELLGFVGRVLKEEGITFADFVELDERPGQYPGGYDGIHGAWHFRLRQWRNNSDEAAAPFTFFKGGNDARV